MTSIMTLQASSVLSSVLNQDLSDIDPALRPLESSSPALSTTADGEIAIDEPIEDGKITHKRTSEVWDHSFYFRHHVKLNNKGQSIWRCKYCAKIYIESGRTGNAKTHLIKHHNR